MENRSDPFIPECDWAGAAQWLNGICKSQDPATAAPDTVLQVAVAAYACHRYGGASTGLALLHELATGLPRCWADITPEYLADEAQPILLILGHQALKAAGSASKLLGDATEVLQDALANLDPADRQSPAVLQLSRLLGLCSQAEVEAAAVNWLLPPEQFLMANPETIHRQCLAWSLLTDYGRRPVNPVLHPAVDDLGDVLPAVALSLCRYQQLDLAGEALRVQAYLSLDSRALADGAAFLAFQQRSDGSFGFLNPLAPHYSQFQEGRLLRFHLPATVAVLHTLGELKTRIPLLAPEGAVGV